MSDLNSKHNRAVWFDIPVANLERAQKFYQAMLGIAVHAHDMQGFKFCVLDHQDGNGGCLIEKPEHVTQGGILLYLNANGRIKDAVAKAKANGGKVLEDVKSIGPHGFRAVVLDSEGNRVALHSETA